jgi:hypothetical protein
LFINGAPDRTHTEKTSPEGPLIRTDVRVFANETLLAEELHLSIAKIFRVSRTAPMVFSAFVDFIQNSLINLELHTLESIPKRDRIQIL